MPLGVAAGRAGRVFIGKSHLPISHGDLEELLSHIVISRTTQELMRYGRMNIANKVIPDMMYIRDMYISLREGVHLT